MTGLWSFPGLAPLSATHPMPNDLPDRIAAELRPAFAALHQPLDLPVPEDCLVVPVLRVDAEIRQGSAPGLFNIRIGEATTACNLDARRVARFLLRARISYLAECADWSESDDDRVEDED